MSDHIRELPILALRGLNLFPGTIMHFDVKREKSISALEYAMQNGQRIFLTAQRDRREEDPDAKEALYKDGTITKIKQIIKLPNKIVRVLAEGVDRGQIVQVTQTRKIFSSSDGFILTGSSSEFTK